MDPDQLLVDLVVGALRLPGAPRDHGSHAGELEDREQGEQRAEGASGAAARQGPSCVTWRVVHDNGSRWGRGIARVLTPLLSRLPVTLPLQSA